MSLRPEGEFDTSHLALAMSHKTATDKPAWKRSRLVAVFPLLFEAPYRHFVFESQAYELPLQFY